MKNTLIAGVILLSVGNVLPQLGLANGLDAMVDKAQIPSITMKELKERSDSLSPDEVILDVRTREEYVEGHVPGAINIPHEDVEEYILELSKYKTIYAYCGSGRRAQIAVEALAKKGLRNLVHIKGGMADWIQLGYPVERN